MITCTNLSYRYPSTDRLALREVNVSIPDRAFVLVTGVSGVGKSTLLRAFNGLVPHFYGGQYAGSVQLDGVDTLSVQPRGLARQVGFVFQDPETQVILPVVEDEMAFGLENQGISPDEISARLSDTLDLLGIAHLRRRAISSLSGGEAQRVAIASVLALEPRFLVLDEPTSQLDPPAAHALLDTLVSLNQRRGLTVILAEHRLERILPYATHVLHLGENGILFGPPREILPQMALHPPVVEMGIRLGWQPLPLSVEEARIFVSPASADGLEPRVYRDSGSEIAIEVRDVTAGYDRQLVLERFNWTVRRGEIVGLLGVNGAGKSTLLKSLVGLLKPKSGDIHLLGKAVAGQRLEAIAHTIGYVPQNPNSVLFADTLRDEMRFTLRNHKLAGDGEAFLERLGLADLADRYPRDLSGGERQRAAMAAMLVPEPPIVLLDEPTRGLDYVQKRGLRNLLVEWAVSHNTTIVVATHDIEWIAALATRATVLSQGQIIADGPMAQVLLETPGFNTQLGELFGDPALLTAETVNQPS